MTQEFASYNRTRQRKINDICQKMREGKERKKLSQPPPEHPVEITESCFEVTVKRYINGNMIERNYFLDGFDFGTSFVPWDRTLKSKPEKRGIMGQQKAFKLISSDFPRIRRMV